MSLPKRKLKVSAEDIYSDTLYFKCSFYHLTPECRTSVKNLSSWIPKEFHLTACMDCIWNSNQFRPPNDSNWNIKIWTAALIHHTKNSFQETKLQLENDT